LAVAWSFGSDGYVEARLSQGKEVGKAATMVASVEKKWGGAGGQ
jgi:hypothetical protein